MDIGILGICVRRRVAMLPAVGMRVVSHPVVIEILLIRQCLNRPALRLERENIAPRAWLIIGTNGLNLKQIPQPKPVQLLKLIKLSSFFYLLN